MKKQVMWTAIIALATISVIYGILAFAHHMSPADPEIGDMQGMHEAVIDERLAEDTGMGSPSDTAVKNFQGEETGTMTTGTTTTTQNTGDIETGGTQTSTTGTDNGGTMDMGGR